MRAGIIIDSFSASQMSMALIKQINNINRANQYIDIVVFYHRYGKLIIPPKFGIFHETNMWNFNGPVMSTDINTTKKLASCPTPAKKFFYVWNLEWMYRRHNVIDIGGVYCNPNINLIARSKEHADIIESCWKKPIAILEDFNYEQLNRIFSE